MMERGTTIGALSLLLCLGCQSGGQEISSSETSAGAGAGIPQGFGGSGTTDPTNPNQDPGEQGVTQFNSGNQTNSCETHDDCGSGYCADTPEGGICTNLCSDNSECPEGFLCKMTLTNAGLKEACTHPLPNGCSPCKTDEDCGSSANFSVGCHEIAGNYVCLASCSADQLCPPGFACAPAPGNDTMTLCVPMTGSCKCHKKFLGAQGLCTRSSAHGTCEGSFTCSIMGTAQCDATVPIAELCNQQDDDCDGATDESDNPNLNCSVCASSCQIQTAAPFELTEENANGLDLDEAGNIILGEADFESHFIWIANSQENTMSKLDTMSGAELARYRVCTDPSRTSVDLLGDCWVACRGDGRVMKVRNFPDKCTDKNGNGIIDTSIDSNGDGKIQGAEMLPAGQDECIHLDVTPSNDSVVRAAGVDAENHAWIGLWNNKKLLRLDPESGEVVATLSIPAQPYGLAIDQNGIIWVSGRGGNLLIRADPETGAVSSHSPPSGCLSPYGIAVDANGNIWMGNYGCGPQNAWRYEPANGTWSSAVTSENPRGIAASLDGFIYVANDSTSRVAKVHAETMGVMGFINLGANRFPVGVAVDSQGFIWAVNQSSSTITKADPNTLEVLSETPVGTGPYTYSDMTGYSLMNFTSPSGSYKTLFEAPMRQPVPWGQVSVEADLPGDGKTWLTLRVRAANQLMELIATAWKGPFGPFPPEALPLSLVDESLFGLYLQVEVTLHTKAGGMTPVVKSISAMAQF